MYVKHDLGEGEFDVLAALRRAGAPFGRAPGELARHTMVTSGAMTKRLDRLVAADLVERREAVGDGRRLLDAVPAQDRPVLESILAAWLSGFESPRTY